jgi:hypothetical protein
MPVGVRLGLTVFVVVLGMTVLLGVVGYLIDRRAARHEREGR